MDKLRLINFMQLLAHIASMSTVHAQKTIIIQSQQSKRFWTTCTTQLRGASRFASIVAKNGAATVNNAKPGKEEEVCQQHCQHIIHIRCKNAEGLPMAGETRRPQGPDQESPGVGTSRATVWAEDASSGSWHRAVTGKGFGE